jgi:hypothetical protein
MPPVPCCGVGTRACPACSHACVLPAPPTLLAPNPTDGRPQTGCRVRTCTRCTRRTACRTCTSRCCSWWVSPPLARSVPSSGQWPTRAAAGLSAWATACSSPRLACWCVLQHRVPHPGLGKHTCHSHTTRRLRRVRVGARVISRRVPTSSVCAGSFVGVVRARSLRTQVHVHNPRFRTMRAPFELVSPCGHTFGRRKPAIPLLAATRTASHFCLS